MYVYSSMLIQQQPIIECSHCDHVDHAAFNIALRQGIGQSVADRDVTEGNTDIPKEATPRTMETLEPHELYRGSMSRIRKTQ